MMVAWMMMTAVNGFKTYRLVDSTGLGNRLNVKGKEDVKNNQQVSGSSNWLNRDAID